MSSSSSILSVNENGSFSSVDCNGSSSSKSLSESSDRNISHSEDQMLYGLGAVSTNHQRNSFCTNISEALKKNTVEMTYEPHEMDISPFEILSDFPNGDFSSNLNLTWKGSLNVCVTIPAYSPIDYPAGFTNDQEHCVMVDVMKCTSKLFKGRGFYFPSLYNPEEDGKSTLSNELCNASCYFGFSAV